MAEPSHAFSALAARFGQHGPQDVHYHVCVDGACADQDGCDLILVGGGRVCGGSDALHQRARIGNDREVAEAARLVRPHQTAEPDEERYGFRWGPLLVQRTASVPRPGGASRVLTLATDAGRKLEVYVSPTGRSIRVYSDGKELR